VRVIVDGRTYEGRAVDLTEVDVSATAIVESIGAENPPIRVDCPAPEGAHEHVRRLPPSTFDRRAALAAAARALGHASPARSALDDARSELAEVSTPPVDVDAARRRVAETGEREEHLRERVAELRGRLQARRETGADTTAVEAQLNEATSRLAEAETERIAAEQALERAEAVAREARDRRERRLELEDRVANLEREVRQDLAAAVWERFRTALQSVPGTATVGSTPGTYDGDRVTAALAVARLAPLDAPVVVDGLDRFGGAEAAASTLRAPVIYVG
jgi:chromosome segregation ATPase